MRSGIDVRHLSYDYGRYLDRNWRFFEPLFWRIRPIPPVLDIGSGLGFFIECCRQHEMPALGMEISQEGVRESAKRKLPVVRADVTVLFPFRDGVFGSAFAHQVLEHVSLANERHILRETYRVLRRGGFLFAVSPNVHHPLANEDPDHVNLFTPHQLARELRAAGYRKVTLGTNFWRPVWEPVLPLGRIGTLLSGALWKIAPLDRLAGSASALAWK